MKNNNTIIVGGTIAAGKSTLVNYLSKKFVWKPIYELRKQDKFQKIILNKLYEKNRIHSETIQLYFLKNRLKQYQEIVNNKNQIHILDRGLWEDIIFAKLLVTNNKSSFQIYEVFWRKTIENIVKKWGIPKVYIFLKINWQTFQKRIYSRNRQSEINNFQQNSNYFKNLIKEYNNNFINILKEWNIKTIIIDTLNLSKQEVFEKTAQLLQKELNI